ncbi:MAG: bifunctional UDP-sugar hydrolase/5'-nucleotidase [Halanaerobacter sp.]
MISIAFFFNHYFFQTEKINIIHTDALKAQVLPEEKEGGVKEGGLALLSAGIEKAKEKRAASETILLDAGSSLTGSSYSYYTQGEVMVEAFNHLDYDAVALGNREFDLGISFLKEALEPAEFSPLAANVKRKSDDSRPFESTLITETEEGTKVAVIGLTYENMAQVTLESNTEDLEFESADLALDRLLSELESKADILILISSLKPQRDREIAEQYGEQLDLIISRTDEYDFLSTPLEESGVDIVRTAGEGKSVGSYLLEYQPGEGVVETDWFNLAVTDKELAPDIEVGKLVADYTARLDQILTQMVGSSRGGIKGIEEGARRESEIGNFLTDALLAETGAEIALLNQGGIRAGFDEKIRAEDIYDVFPFPSSVTLLELEGKEIRRLLERSATFAKDPLLPAGLKYIYDPEKDKGERVVSIKVDGQELKPERNYEVATIDFLADGGDNYVEFEEAENIRYLSQKMRVLITDYIKSNSPVEAELDGRFKPVKESGE